MKSKMKSKNLNRFFINKVIQGDAIEIMRQIPDNLVDMAFTDLLSNLEIRTGEK